MINKQISSYHITAEIARSQLATIYMASKPNSPLKYAIKVLDIDLRSEPSFRQASREQAKLVSSLEHEWLVPWYEVGEADNEPYFVMPFMAGGSLRERLEKEGALSLEESVKILSHLADVLDYVHEQGLLHLDIKPSNILFEEHVPHLSDLGIARMMAHTRRATYASTPSQMAPEQWRKRTLDARTDIYQLGVLLFEMLTGQLPFTAYTPSSFMHRHVYDPVPSACKLAPDLPAACDVLLAKAMAKEPAQRFGSASELLAELRRLIEDEASAEAPAMREVLQEEVLQEVPPQEVPLQEEQEQEEPLLDVTIPEPFIVTPKEEPDLDAQQAEYRRLIQNATQVLRHDPTSLFALNMRANLYLALKQPEKAAQDATDALQSTPHNIIFLKLRAEANLMLERYDSALSDAQRILNYDPTSPFGLHIEEYATDMLDSPTADELLTKNLDVEVQKYNAIMKQTHQALTINPNDVEALTMRANVYFEGKDYEKAVEDTTKVLELDPDYIECLLLRAQSYLQLEKYKEALIDVDAYLKQYPDSGQAIDLKEKASKEFKNAQAGGGCVLFFTLLPAMALFGWLIEAPAWFWLLTILLPSLSAYLMSSHKPQSNREDVGCLIWVLGFVFLCVLFFWI